jgi:uncharacterized membrane protein YhaH (DUF805 family)
MTEPPRNRPATGLPAAHVLRLWFGFRDAVDRRTYVGSGVLLMALKYAVDALVVYRTLHLVWSPLSYLSPLYSLRVSDFRSAPSWLFAGMAVWALPFMWIGVTMSVRRAVDAGLSAWVGVLFMVPLLNYAVILLLSVVPSKPGVPWSPHAASVYRGVDEAPPSLHIDSGVKSALFGVLGAVSIGLVMVGLTVYALGSYGASLFALTPFVMGAISAFVYNRPYARATNKTILVALASCVIAGCAMLLFALEGFVCLLMAFPIAGGIATLGALVGRAIAVQSKTSTAQTAALLLMLPPVAGAEAKLAAPPLHEVASVVEIDATPEQVWPNVIGFAELPAPAEWVFRTGIAFPMRARIEGSGVGAVRHCEFSTGAFVEPITAWEPGVRLAFDVSAQPPAMKEWSPFRHVHPPHLDHSIRSRRGEFRLVALPGGRTRLEGSTWYELSMAPETYWAGISDMLIHAIHTRVLEHVKHLSEGSPRP